MCVFFFQAEDGIRDLVRSRGLGDVYKRQPHARLYHFESVSRNPQVLAWEVEAINDRWRHRVYTDPYLNPNWADHRAQLIEPTNW